MSAPLSYSSCLCSYCNLQVSTFRQLQTCCQVQSHNHREKMIFHLWQNLLSHLWNSSGEVMEHLSICNVAAFIYMLRSSFALNTQHQICVVGYHVRGVIFFVFDVVQMFAAEKHCRPQSSAVTEFLLNLKTSVLSQDLFYFFVRQSCIPTCTLFTL